MLGMLSAKVPLDMVKYLVKEDSLIVWTTALYHLQTWKKILQETSVRERLEEFTLSLLDPLYEQLKWEDKGGHVER